MNKIIGCTLIIKDDFDNVLISRKKVKKNEPKVWSLFERILKKKETTEKCVNRIVKEDLKTIIFDLEPLDEYVINEESKESLLFYTGKIKEAITMGNSIAACKWVGKNSLDQYDFAPGEKEKILAFFDK